MVQRHEVWTRLAQTNIYLGMKEEACNVLILASEVEPKVWEIWRELIVVSAYCNNFDKTVQAYLEVIKLGHSYLNLEVLDRIVYGMTEECKEDCKYNSKPELRAKLMQIFDKLIYQFQKYSPVYCSYAVAIAYGENTSSEERMHTISLLKQSIKILLENKRWFLFRNKIKHIMESAILITNAYLVCSEKFKGTLECPYLLRDAQAFVHEMMEKIGEYHRNCFTDSVIAVFADDYNKLEELRKTIENKLKQNQ